MSRNDVVACFNGASRVEITWGPGNEEASLILEMGCSKSWRPSAQVRGAPRQLSPYHQSLEAIFYSFHRPIAVTGWLVSSD